MDNEITLTEHIQRISQLGGQARTEAQRLARQANVKKARKAKLLHRHGLLAAEPVIRARKSNPKKKNAQELARLALLPEKDK